MKKKIKTVSDLRKNGYRVYVKHKRVYLDDIESQRVLGQFKFYNATDIDEYSRIVFSRSDAEIRNLKKLSSYGGATEIEIYQGDQLLSKAVAFCSPNEHYNSKIGRQIALGRAIKNVNFLFEGVNQ